MSVDDSDFDWNCGGGNASGCSGDSRTHYCISGVSLLSEADPFAYFMGRNGKNRDRDLEEKLESLDNEMAANATNSKRLSELAAEREQTEADLEHKMERWEYLEELAEKINAQNEN